MPIMCSSLSSCNNCRTASSVCWWRHFSPPRSRPKPPNSTPSVPAPPLTFIANSSSATRRTPTVVAVSKWFTALWGLVAIGFALYAHLVENLIQAVNILGSIFYGVMLGLFVVAFFIRRVGGTAVFWAALVGADIGLCPLFQSDHFLSLVSAHRLRGLRDFQHRSANLSGRCWRNK